jgi:hypothetical protein
MIEDVFWRLTMKPPLPLLEWKSNIGLLYASPKNRTNAMAVKPPFVRTFARTGLLLNSAPFKNLM